MKKLSLLLLLTPIYSFAQRAPGVPSSPYIPLMEGMGQNLGDSLPVFFAVAAAIITCKLIWNNIYFIIDWIQTVSGRNR